MGPVVPLAEDSEQGGQDEGDNDSEDCSEKKILEM
jgi:hypothetical protein